MIILSGGIKGGAGKSTIATNLTIMRALAGRDVLLIDADTQASSTNFTKLRYQELGDAGYTCTKLDGRAVLTDGKRLAEKYDDLVIDAGGRDTTSQRAALLLADKIVIPFVPRSFDVWTLKEVAEMIEEARVMNPNLVAYSFINKADSAGSENEDAAEYIQETETIKFIDTPLGYRKVFGKAVAQGLAVVEYTPKDIKATSEFNNFYNMVFS